MVRVTKQAMVRLTMAAGALLATEAPAFAHAELDFATPAVGSSGPAPRQVKLTFTQRLERAFSSADVRNAAGGKVGGQSSVNGNTMSVSVGQLPSGSYTVNWRVLSVDTHKTQGSFSFTVSR